MKRVINESNIKKYLKNIILEEIELYKFKKSILNEAEVDITKDEAVKIIEDTKGKIFTVVFIKRSDGTERIMNARLGVKSRLKGGTLPYSPKEKRLIPVFDLKSDEYRMINKDTIKMVKVGNNIYNVK